MASQLNTNTATLENLRTNIENIPSPYAGKLSLDVSANITAGTVVAVNGADSVIGTLENSVASIRIPSDGQWTVYAVSGERVAEKNMCTFVAPSANIELVFFEATVGCYVMSGEAVEVTCTNGATTYTATGTGAVNFTVYERGTWTVSAMIDGMEWTYSPDAQTVGGTYMDIFGEVSTTLNDNSWDAISLISSIGAAANYWSVGDTKQIVINGKVGRTSLSELSIWAFILGFDHNNEVEGNNTIHFQIGKSAQMNGKNLCLVDSENGRGDSTTSGYFQMSLAKVNNGGWKTSTMRTDLLGNSGTPSAPLSGSLMAALPSDLRSVMKAVTKYSDNTGGGSDIAYYVTSTTDYLWLLAEYEVQGARTKANSAEQNYQKQYAYYANGNSKVFYKDSATSNGSSWWLRSVMSMSLYYFLYVDKNSSTYYGNSPYFSYGLAPAFCV